MTKKRKVGRPVEVKDAKRVLIVLSAADVKLLKALSEKEHRSVSELIREVVRDYAKTVGVSVASSCSDNLTMDLF